MKIIVDPDPQTNNNTQESIRDSLSYLDSSILDQYKKDDEEEGEGFRAITPRKVQFESKSRNKGYH